MPPIFDPVIFDPGIFDTGSAPGPLDVSVAQVQPKQEQQASVAVSTALTVAQEQKKQEESSGVSASTALSVVQEQPKQEQASVGSVSVSSSVAQEQPQQEESSSVTVSGGALDCIVAQEQAQQGEEAQALAVLAAAPGLPQRQVSIGGAGGPRGTTRLSSPKAELFPLSRQKAFKPKSLTTNRWIKSLGKKPFKGL